MRNTIYFTLVCCKMCLHVLMYRKQDQVFRCIVYVSDSLTTLQWDRKWKENYGLPFSLIAHVIVSCSFASFFFFCKHGVIYPLPIAYRFMHINSIGSIWSPARSLRVRRKTYVWRHRQREVFRIFGEKDPARSGNLINPGKCLCFNHYSTTHVVSAS